MFEMPRELEEEDEISEGHYDEYRSGLDDVPTARQERDAERNWEPPVPRALIQAARIGCAGAMGDYS